MHVPTEENSLERARVYVAAGWLGAHIPVIPSAGNPGIPVARSFVWWLWMWSICKEGVLHVVGAGGSSHAFPHVHKPLCTSTVAQAGGHGINMASPCAATLLGLKVPGPCLPWTGSCFPLVQADLYAEVSKRFSAPCLTPGLLFCLLCAHL